MAQVIPKERNDAVVRYTGSIELSRYSMEKELISVIVPVYNIERYLPRCLDCIANQTYRYLEIILVDDGSTDGSGQLCDAFAARDTRAKVIHQKNHGLWAARNAGQDVATGDYLFFPDGDDYFHQDLIRLLYEAINSNRKYDLAIAREKQIRNVSEDITSPITPQLIEQTNDNLIKGLLSTREDRFYVYMWNKLYRKKLIQNVRSRDFVRSQDFDFNLRTFQNVSNAVLIDNDLYFWLQHPGSLTMHKDSTIWMLSCRSRILYGFIKEYPMKYNSYSHYLLPRLYKIMIQWKARSVDTNDKVAVFQECKGYEKDVRNTFISDRRIRFIEKAGYLLLFLYPRLTKLLMQVTNNL